MSWLAIAVFIAWMLCGGILVHSIKEFGGYARVQTRSGEVFTLAVMPRVTDSRRVFRISRFTVGDPFRVHITADFGEATAHTHIRIDSLRVEYPDGTVEPLVSAPEVVPIERETRTTSFSGALVEMVDHEAVFRSTNIVRLDPTTHRGVRVTARISILSNNQVVDTVDLNGQFMLEETFRIYPYIYDFLRTRA
ncbi:MAG: hypothetical protein WD069_07845 [Planctomycetales bacterium]